MSIFALLFFALSAMFINLFFTFVDFLNIENTLFEEVLKMGISNFFMTYFLLLMASSMFFMASVSLLFAIRTSKNRDLSDTDINIASLFAKFLIIASTVIAMLISMSETQFSVATTVISFVAIFSFMFPEKQKDQIKIFIQNIKKKLSR